MAQLVDIRRRSSAAFWDGTRVAAHALRASGCVFAAAYPGSPVTNIADELKRLDQAGALQFRYAINEKVAFEMCAAAAFAGHYAAAVMKNAGLNVAMDAIAAVAYLSVDAPLLIVVGDDPGCESSSTAQDSRRAAQLLGVPCLEARSPADIVTVVRSAAQLSSDYRSVVMVRLTTEICYSSEMLELNTDGDAAARADGVRVPRDQRFVLVPMRARSLHGKLHGKLEDVRSQFDASGIEVLGNGDVSGRVGYVVGAHVHRAFVRAQERLGVRLPSYTAGLAWPMSRASLLAFASRFDELVVVEELDAVLEEQVLSYVHEANLPVRVSGRKLFPKARALGELEVARALGELLGLAQRPVAPPLAVLERPPTFCPGCPHSAFFAAMLAVLDDLPERPFISSDVGCYGLAAKPGFEVGDSIICMGSSIGVALGMALRGVPTVAIIGDSTFFHAGMPALLNAVQERVDLTVCILDNSVIGNTGAQPTLAEQGGDTIYAAALALGVRKVTIVDPFEHSLLTANLREGLVGGSGVSVLIARSPCALTVAPKRRRPVVDVESCNGCRVCVTQLHCPAISLGSEGKFQVNELMCVGCGLCASICPEGALTPTEY